VTGYFFVAKLNDGLVRLTSEEYGQQLFSIRKLRKPAECVVCNAKLAVGDRAFADATSCAANRMQRICVGCVFGSYQRSEP
jgi:hypothetical protein